MIGIADRYTTWHETVVSRKPAPAAHCSRRACRSFSLRNFETARRPRIGVVLWHVARLTHVHYYRITRYLATQFRNRAVSSR